ncbi:hypothetical protein XX58_004993 [Salmonella enterica subsp. salamae]|uniref:DUF7336 domain-containing protein n=8 Tax=Salmonella enterica TaxID=28901 RepID=A0A3U9TDG9_SALER|nr:hypothetical protein [Salmonella enterica]EAA4439002.1 hypothetical protein [Salmonella enterica subsp. salamae]EBP3810828.1 hypothetical protein [Salmonella enterica subsp. enterica]EKR2157962.1 hypothetical protein [Salmonella enterica subsp. salamae serovar 40:c:z6]MBA2993286.1 hypothetical protein [Salmonella enterica subsp. salamae serovar 47:z:e,n,x,z15]HAC6415000.1 hypothetical protein [Salmonella enterica subsp. salamae serovar 58:a:-]HAC6508143.1 hypothetical protein [Salmonella e
MNLYVLWHIYDEDMDNEREEIIGVYTSEQLAKMALKRAEGQLRFTGPNNKLDIDLYTLNRDYWVDGFGI